VATDNPDPTTPAAAPPPDPRQRALRIAAVLFAGTFLLYARSLGYPLVNFDDAYYLLDHDHVRTGLTAGNVWWALTTGYFCNWHPVTWLSYQLDATVFGGPDRVDSAPVAGFRLTNLVLHAANAALLFWLLRDMTGATWRAAAVAALWAWHPLRVESVVWVSERKDVLSTLFLLLAVAAYVRYARGPTAGRYLLVAALLAAGLMAKSMLVTLPCGLLLLDYWPLGRATGPGRVGAGRLVAEKVPLLALAAVAAGVAVYTQGVSGAVAQFEHLPLPNRLANAAISYAAYLYQTAWPAQLGLFYPGVVWGLSGPVVAAAAGLLAVTAGCVAWGRSFPYLPVGWLWFLGTMVPVIGLIQVGAQARADRYTYVPSIGLLVMAVWGAADLFARARPRVPAGVAAAVLAACIVLTWVQVGRWADDVTLWTHTLNVTRKPNVVARIQLGIGLSAAGRKEEAVPHWQAVVRLQPDRLIRLDLAKALVTLGREDEGLPELAGFLEHHPGSKEGRKLYGLLLAQRGRPDEAFPHLLAARDGPRAEFEARVECGQQLFDRQFVPQARDQFERAIALDPADAKARLLLGLAFVFEGRMADAEGALREAVRLAPGDVQALTKLGLVLGKRGAAGEAVGFCERAVAADPLAATLRADYALVLGAAGRPADAAREYAAATARDPKWVATAITVATDALGWKPGLSLFLPTCQVREACEATGYRRPEAVVTLAAALAVDGDFKGAEAVLLPLRAEAEKAENEAAVAEIDGFLALYRAGRSVRNPPPRPE
jgi:Flp pilus assembly protein TadD